MEDTEAPLDNDTGEMGKISQPCTPELFSFDEVDSENLESLHEQGFYDTIDDCIDESRESELFSIAKYIQSPKRTKRLKVGPSKEVKPVAFIRFNTRLGKAKPVTIRALLDSGGSESLIAERHVKKLRVKQLPAEKAVWTTPAGDMTTKAKVKSQFTIPELQQKKLIEWDSHVAKDLGACDVIIGRDMPQFSGIDICFSDMTIQWENEVMPFKDANASPLESYHIPDRGATADASDRIKKILDAKYEAADLEKICSAQDQLS